MSVAEPSSRLSDSAEEIAVDAPASGSGRRNSNNNNAGQASSPLTGSVQRPVSSPFPAISVSELRAGMQQHLKSSGGLKMLKTQLRGMVLTEMMHQQRHMKRAPNTGKDAIGEGLPLEDFEAYRRRAAAAAGGGASGVNKKRASKDAGINDSNIHGGRASPEEEREEEPSPSSFSSWSACVADAVVENHLRRTHRPMSLSIFSTEAEVAPLSDSGAPSEEERCLRQLLLLSQPGDINDVSNLDDEIDDPGKGNSGTTRRGGKTSLLQQLIAKQLLNRESIEEHYRTHRHHCGTQTYEADKKQNENEKNPLLSLECRLAAVDAKYSLAFSQLGHHGNRSFFTRAEVDRRLQQYKADIHEQLRAEYEQKYKAFEANKLQDVKDTLESRYQLLVRNKSEELAEMQRSLMVKFEQDKERLQQQRADVERRAMELDRKQSSMQSVVSDRDLEIANCEAVITALKDKLRVAQLQCAKWEELSGSRLMEADTARSRERRRGEEIQRMQAEHAAEMRLKEEELSRLRFRLRMLLNHPSGPSDERGNATAGAAVAGAPSSPSQQDRMNEDLYRVLVRTEELQRNTLDQQRQVQRQQELDMEARLKENWDTAWQQGQQQQQGRGAAPQAAARAGEPAASPAQVPTAAVAAAPSSPAKASTSPSSSNKSSAPPPAARATAASPSSPSPPPAVQQPKEAGRTSPPPTAPTTASSSSSSSSSTTSLEDSPIAAPTAEVKSVSHSPSPAPSSSTTAGGNAKSASTSEEKRRSKSSASSATASRTGAAEASEERERKVAQMVTQETADRETVEEEEDTNRKGIEWSASSQRSVIEAKERDKRQHEESMDDDSSRHGGGGGFLDRLEQQRQELRAQQEAEGNVIYRNSDDDNDDILFGNKSDDDTDSEF